LDTTRFTITLKPRLVVSLRSEALVPAPPDSQGSYDTQPEGRNTDEATRPASALSGNANRLPEDVVRLAVVAKGSLWSLGGNGLTLLASAAATPFTLRLLGPKGYGLWSLLQVAIAYLALADFGTSAGSTRFAAAQFEKASAQGEAAVIWTSAFIAGVITGAVAGLVALFAPAIADHLIRPPADLRPDAILALRLLAGGFFARAIANCLNTSQLIRLRWAGHTLITTVVMVSQIVLVPVVLAVFHVGVGGAAAVILTTFIALAVFHFLYSAKLQPALRHPRLEISAMPTLARFGVGLTIAGGMAIFFSAERFFFTGANHLSDVAYYSVASSLALLITVVPVAATLPLLPALSRLRATNQWERLRSLFREAITGLTVVGTPVALALAFCAQPFLRLWAGSAYAHASTAPFWVMLAGLWLHFGSLVSMEWLQASGRTALIAKVNTIQVPIYLAASALVVPRFGVMGAAAVWSLRIVVEAVVLVAIVCRDISVPFRRLAKDVMARAADCLPLAFALVLSAQVTPTLIVRLAVGFCLTFAHLTLIARLRYPSIVRAQLSRLRTRYAVRPSGT
jgi:O-antigen/teichoic acid export membrane protein